MIFFSLFVPVWTFLLYNKIMSESDFLFDGFVSHEVLFSNKVLRTCCVCGSERYIFHLVQYRPVLFGYFVEWRCSSNFRCFSDLPPQ
ncbi:hypothetical protein [uncultured Gammaproteobacteria bacterium]|nr:hypothetical protein [uncultured Gammaproteobacteria bacterium]